MTIPNRRQRLPRASITRPLMLAIALLAGLIVLTIMIKRQNPETDTLEVKGETFLLNDKQVNINELWNEYSGLKKRRKLIVEFDENMSFGETWPIRDSLKKLDDTYPRLVIEGLDEVMEFE